jgi:hypothetical protein
MVEGIGNDDKYRMVEDEFLALAGDYTRHLHAAEYQRLKTLAKSQNAETIQNISRPVTGDMTDLVQRRHAALATAAKQRKGIAAALGKRAGRDSSDSSDEEGPSRWAGTSLQGLMDSPRKKEIPLAAIAAGGRAPTGSRGLFDASPSRRSRHTSSIDTRMKEGNISQAHLQKNGLSSKGLIKREPISDSDDDDDDDDLNAQIAWPPKYQNRNPLGQPRKPEVSLLDNQPSIMKPPARPAERTPASIDSVQRSRTFSMPDLIQPTSGDQQLNSNDDDDDDDDDFFSRLRARRAEQRRKREAPNGGNIKISESQTIALNEIPFI